jgi:serine/threonine protein kinase
MLETVQFLQDRMFVMHSDISIRNWLIKDNGQLVLSDFGSSRVLGPFGYVKPGEP